MTSGYDVDRAAQLVLALMSLELHQGNRAWKGYPWEVLDRLFELGLILDPKNKTKSVALTEQGRAQADAAFRHLLSVAQAADAAQAGDVSHTSTLTDLQQMQVRKLLAPLCELPPDPAIRSQLQIGVRLEGQSAVLFEMRPAFRKPGEWLEEPVAKFTHVKKSKKWRLLCMLRDLKWHTYEPLPEAPELAPLVEEVHKDPTGIFWG